MTTQQKDKVRKLFQRSPIWTIPAVLTSIDGTTCTVTLSDGQTTVNGISLQSAAEATGVGFNTLPRIGSLLMVSAMDGKMDKLYISGIADIERIELPEGYHLTQIKQEISLIHPDGRTIALTTDALNKLF